MMNSFWWVSVTEGKMIKVKGTYIITSAYCVYMDRVVDSESSKGDEKWFMLWELQVPPKVYVFLWMLCQDCLPTRICLQTRGIICPRICVICECQLKNSWHMFFTCNRNILYWKEVNLWRIIEQNMDWGDGFKQAVFHMCAALDGNQMSRFVIILWYLWLSRNEELWEGKDGNANQVVTCAREFLLAWNHVHKQ